MQRDCQGLENHWVPKRETPIPCDFFQKSLNAPTVVAHGSLPLAFLAHWGLMTRCDTARRRPEHTWLTQHSEQKVNRSHENHEPLAAILRLVCHDPPKSCQASSFMHRHPLQSHWSSGSAWHLDRPPRSPTSRVTGVT